MRVDNDVPAIHLLQFEPFGLGRAIWKSAWFAVNEKRCSRELFVAMVIDAAADAYDRQVANADKRPEEQP